VARSHFHGLPWPGQAYLLSERPRPGYRRCLLKGCRHWFRATHPQACYCSDTCRQKADQWRRWRARQRYRASVGGRKRRREQSNRYRQRLKERLAAAQVEQTAVPTPVREGGRLPKNPRVFGGCPCARPGCYCCFIPSARAPHQRFCSLACRQALRRVRQRELRRYARRRRGGKPRRWRPRAEPKPSP
jgi:hypothetical protein